MKTKKEWCSHLKKSTKEAIFELHGKKGLTRYNLDWDSFTIDFSNIGSDCYSYFVKQFIDRNHFVIEDKFLENAVIYDLTPETIK